MLKPILFILIALILALIIAILSLQASETWSKAEVVRTPDTHFENLPDYPFPPNYVESNGYRVHYVDQGPKDGQVILLMHGQPSWSYLYRHMIPLLSNAGYRVIAPDNVGFGKSDKPLKPEDHSYQMHIDIMADFVDALNLNDITFFGQDWGGLIGLRVIEQRPNRFARIMISNTTLPAAPGIKGLIGYPLFRASVWKEGDVQELSLGGENFSFATWVAYAKTTNKFDFAGLFQQATSRQLSDAELAGYSAPYPNNESIAAVRMFPTLVASQLRQNQVVMDDFYSKWNKPFITAFGSDDSLMAGRDKVWQNTVPGAKNQKHTTVDGGAHFIQEDKPEELVRIMLEFIKDNN